MKYAIKKVGTNLYAHSTDPVHGYWPMTDVIEQAQQFGSITEVLEMFILWARIKPRFNYDWTIVGLREENVPALVEVAL